MLKTSIFLPFGARSSVSSSLPSSSSSSSSKPLSSNSAPSSSSPSKSSPSSSSPPPPRLPRPPPPPPVTAATAARGKTTRGAATHRALIPAPRSSLLRPTALAGSEPPWGASGALAAARTPRALAACRLLVSRAPRITLGRAVNAPETVTPGRAPATGGHPRPGVAERRPDMLALRPLRGAQRLAVAAPPMRQAASPPIDWSSICSGCMGFWCQYRVWVCQRRIAGCGSSVARRLMSGSLRRCERWGLAAIPTIALHTRRSH